MVENDWENCAPDHPISVLHMHGTNDPLIPYDGAENWSLGRMPSAPDIVRYWVDQNGLERAEFEGKVEQALISGNTITTRLFRWSSLS